MPEGDSVHRAARRMSTALVGHTITGSDVRVPRHATASLAGETVTGFVARGKHIAPAYPRRLDGPHPRPDAGQLDSPGAGSASPVTTDDTRPGRNHWVYGRYARPCLRCATPVAFRPPAGARPGDERETWWCPSSQPARPAPRG